jgi:phospholipase C
VSWTERERRERERVHEELADPAAAERVEAEHPEAALRRREFLQSTAAIAGAAGLASVIPANTLVAEAAKRQARRAALPAPKNLPFDTVVVLMMENRSFDHYLGWFPGADAKNTGLSYPDKDGKPVATHRLVPDYQGCSHPDPDHSWKGGRHQLNGGKMDGFVQGDEAGTGSDEFAAGYYLKEDLGFIPHAGEAFTLYDRFFCSLMASTWPNREYMWSAQSGGNQDNTPPVSSAGFQWETIFDRALSKGATARYYNSDLPFSAVWGPRGVGWTSPIEDYYSACESGTLPNIVLVDPPFKDGGGGDGLSADEHPHGDVRLGQAFMSDVVHAFMASKQWKRGALFITYDEWGGFFDHVKPPSVPDDRQSANLDEDFGQMGFRIPAVTISPYTRNRSSDPVRVGHGQYGTESILKLIMYRFGLDFDRTRSDAAPMRVDNATNVGESFDWKHPDFERPDLPQPEHVASKPCVTGGGDLLDSESASAHESDLAELEELAYRFGFKTGDGKAHELFRKPDSVQNAIASS